jgi:DNA polymerase-3 subunit delta'
MARTAPSAAVAEANTPSPRANPELLGHEDAERNLRRLFEAGRLPHALLLTGPRGIGKATLAFRVARFVLASADASRPSAGEGLAIPAESGVFRRVAAGGHADLLTIERAYDPRRRRMRSEIVVDDTREIAAFLRLTAAEGGWRVVIVDGADDMNRNAANAVLKILEEPPQRTLLILVAHSPGRLLPTIRSRCRRLPLAPLSDDIQRQLLARYCPELDSEQMAAVTFLSSGSVGRALDLIATGGVDLYRSILGLLAGSEKIDPLAVHAFAERLVRADAEDAYRVFEDLIGQLLARVARHAARSRTIPEAASANDIAASENAAFRHLATRTSATVWAELRGQISENFARADALNLDRKQTILGAFFAIERAAG